MRVDDAEYYILYAMKILKICVVNNYLPTENQHDELVACNKIISAKGNDNDKKFHLQNLENAKAEFLKDNFTNHKIFDEFIDHFITCCNKQAASINNASPTKNLRSI